MSWRRRMPGYCPTWAEVRMDVALGLEEETIGDHVEGLRGTLRAVMRVTHGNG